MLNVRHPDEHTRKRKADLKPYTSPGDERLKVRTTSWVIQNACNAYVVVHVFHIFPLYC